MISRQGRKVREGTELNRRTRGYAEREKCKPRNRRTIREETRISRINAEFLTTDKTRWDFLKDRSGNWRSKLVKMIRLVISAATRQKNQWCGLVRFTPVYRGLVRWRLPPDKK